MLIERQGESGASPCIKRGVSCLSYSELLQRLNEMNEIAKVTCLQCVAIGGARQTVVDLIY